MVQWLRLRTSNAGSTSLIPGWETKVLHAMGHGQKKKKKKITLKKKSSIPILHPSAFDSLLEWLTELRKALNLPLLVYYKG